MRRAYQSDLSDAEWSCLEPYLATSKTYGRPRLHSPREILQRFAEELTPLEESFQLSAKNKKPKAES
jgi:hypothetical protein